MIFVGVGLIVFVVALLAIGYRNDRRFEERYPLSAALLRDRRDSGR